MFNATLNEIEIKSLVKPRFTPFIPVGWCSYAVAVHFFSFLWNTDFFS